MKEIKVIDLLGASDEELMRISKEGVLSLSLEEMRTLKKYFQKKARNPTDVELETLAQTWSEHCIHKTFRGLIEYEGRIIDNLLKATIMQVTRQLNKKWCISVFKDNAGIISLDRNNAIAFKVETHNHPSALEPYGGAGTGIGGVIRDILGVGLGGKPILNTDIFCFGPPDFPYDKLPEGCLHPKRICKGVVAGVRDYGNRMGIPTANGAIIFDPGYTCNPLVYCGTVGIIPRDKCFKKARPGDLIVAVGGRTGRDGIHGATFSSTELAKDTEVSAVQIGNPIMEKKVTDVILQARDKGLYHAITDCGAGGFSSAAGEMGKDIGIKVYLERAPLKYAGLAPWEIWVSEAQERMVLAVPPGHLKEIMEIFRAENVEATVLGEFTDNKKMHLLYKGKTVGELEMDFLHKGLPRLKRKAKWKRTLFPEPELAPPEDLGPFLKGMLSHPGIASKEWAIRQYDHEVQAATVLKPLQGINNDGPGDGCALKPLFNSQKGIVVSNGINPRYGKIDPYWMAASNIDEALRNNIACGGNLKRCALLDNFCWGNPEKEEQLGALVRAARACYDIAKIYETPFISGKDSLNNEYFDYNTGKRISIPPTLLISAVSVIPDIRKIVSMDLKSAGNLVYMLGETLDELGGSYYYLVAPQVLSRMASKEADYSLPGYVGNNVPRVNPKKAKKLMLSLQQAISCNLVQSCHDCSEGGIGVALAEMCFAGGLGAEISLKNIPGSGLHTSHKMRNDTILFSESNSRFLVEVAAENRKEFEKTMKGNVFNPIGKISKSPFLKVYGLNNKIVLKENIHTLKECWQSPLRW